jgi:hypothetical protein
MMPTTHDTSLVPSRIEHAALELALVVTLAVASVSVIAISLGNPELMASVAFLGVVITLLALALQSRLSPPARLTST